jgi:hypothetical protein
MGACQGLADTYLLEELARQLNCWPYQGIAVGGPQVSQFSQCQPWTVPTTLSHVEFLVQEIHIVSFEEYL